MIPSSIATGPSPQKERFFKECAAAFEFLSAFYCLKQEQQQALVASIQQMQQKEREVQRASCPG